MQQSSKLKRSPQERDSNEKWESKGRRGRKRVRKNCRKEHDRGRGALVLSSGLLVPWESLRRALRRTRNILSTLIACSSTPAWHPTVGYTRSRGREQEGLSRREMVFVWISEKEAYFNALVFIFTSLLLLIYRLSSSSSSLSSPHLNYATVIFHMKKIVYYSDYSFYLSRCDFYCNYVLQYHYQR